MTNYQDFNVTNYLPTFAELVDMYAQRRGKSSKTRFINEELKAVTETRKDLADALATSRNGILHGATHTRQDLNKLDNYINNILKLKSI